jgi:hypothetical protein
VPLDRSRRHLLGGLALAALSLPVCASGPQLPLVLWISRHAEKAEGNDPGLTPRGEMRAQALARFCAELRLDGVWSTDTRRTRATAAPTAAAQGREVAVYSDIAGLASALKAGGGVHLIIGHSNTIAELVRAFGGPEIAALGDQDYDRLEQVICAPGSSLHQRLRQAPFPA